MDRVLKTAIRVLCISGVFWGVRAEKHKVRFDNRCGYGNPHLLKDGKVLSQGEEFVSEGAFTSGIAYLQTGNCDLNGEGCTLVEMTLINAKCPGCGSSVDISLIPPLAYSVPISFSYINGCDGQGAACSSPDCRTAFFVPDDNQVQVQCQDDDVDLLISFCPEGSDSTPTKSGAMSASNATPSKTLSRPQSNATPSETMRGPQSSSTPPRPRFNVSPATPTTARPSTVTSQHGRATSSATILNSNANLAPGKRRCSKAHAERRTSRNRTGVRHHRLNRRAGHLFNS